MADTLPPLAGGESFDPDAQATVTDFLDYTEFFPSDLFRSLTLIGKLDEAYEEDASKIHSLTKTYGALPTLPDTQKPDPRDLRRDITTTLGHALRCRESSHAEAVCLCDVADSLYVRLEGIRKKLHNMPLPPSRDPTPPPKPRSPLRSRKMEERTPRLSLLTGSAQGAGTRQTAPRQKNRSRRIIVPGDVLPPFDPNSPGASVMSDSEPERHSSPIEPLPKIMLKQKARKQLTPVDPAVVAAPKKLIVRPPGIMGTNVHSTVAGISVSNAMAELTPPPPNPHPGSQYAPWFELTDWELHTLRRRMKKNANWQPSDIMKSRELIDRGRGPEAHRQAQAQAASTGTELLNEAPHKSVKIAEALLNGQEVAMPPDEKIEPVLDHEMTLNESKKLKREQRELELQLEMEENMKLIANESSKSEEQFSKMNGSGLVTPKTTKGTAKKRKADEVAEDTPPLKLSLLPSTKPSAPAGKKIKLALTASHPEIKTPATSTSKIPLAPEGPTTDEAAPSLPNGKVTRTSDRAAKVLSSQTPDQTSKPLPATEPTARTRNPSVPLNAKQPKQDAAAATTPASARRTSARTAPTETKAPTSAPSAAYATNTKTLGTTQSLQYTAAGSRERRPASINTSIIKLPPPSPSTTAPRNLARRKSTTALPSKPPAKPVPAPKRPAPQTVVPDAEADEDEELFCFCRQPFVGKMIGCEEGDACKNGVWFHFDCLGWDEMGPEAKKARSGRWFCPLCRERRGVGEWGEALAGKKGRGRGGR
ncbi:MAG: hypothetical protein M1828_004974 [Chrysothrix sp. TS-e1954]|nr:MAG: hypothetical protein M1828_004974 [Chrysothrix sp. TS-e1954]